MKPSSVLHCTVKHVHQRNTSQRVLSALLRGVITTAHIGVDARVDTLEVVAGLCVANQVHWEREAHLVCCDIVVALFHLRRDLKLLGLPTAPVFARQAERGHGVEDTHKVDARRLALVDVAVRPGAFHVMRYSIDKGARERGASRKSEHRKIDALDEAMVAQGLRHLRETFALHALSRLLGLAALAARVLQQHALQRIVHLSVATLQAAFTSQTRRVAQPAVFDPGVEAFCPVRAGVVARAHAGKIDTIDADCWLFPSSEEQACNIAPLLCLVVGKTIVSGAVEKHGDVHAFPAVLERAGRGVADIAVGRLNAAQLAHASPRRRRKFVVRDATSGVESNRSVFVQIHTQIVSVWFDLFEFSSGRHDFSCQWIMLTTTEHPLDRDLAGLHRMTTRDASTGAALHIRAAEASPHMLTINVNIGQRTRPIVEDDDVHFHSVHST